jgi:hypothetical protein
MAAACVRVVAEFTELPLNMVLLRHHETRLIEVNDSYGQARLKDVRVGDVVVELNGQRVMVGLHHDRLAQFIAKSALPLRFTIWRAAPGRKYRDTLVSWSGCSAVGGGGGSGVELASQQTPEGGDANSSSGSGGGIHRDAEDERIEAVAAAVSSLATVTVLPPRRRVAESGVPFLASEVVGAKPGCPFMVGDLIVGVMHAPLSPRLTGAGLISLLSFSSAAASVAAATSGGSTGGSGASGRVLLVNVFRPHNLGRAPAPDPLALAAETRPVPPAQQKRATGNGSSSGGGGGSSGLMSSLMKMPSFALETIEDAATAAAATASSTADIAATTAATAAAVAGSAAAGGGTETSPTNFSAAFASFSAPLSLTTLALPAPPPLPPSSSSSSSSSALSSQSSSIMGGNNDANQYAMRR